MRKKANPRCPMCKCAKTVKKGSRNGKKRYWCNGCRKGFSIDHRRKQPALWIPHMDGIPFRTLGQAYNLSPAAMYNRVKRELNSLPENTWLTATYSSRYCGILVLDGKYVKVRGYKQKIPFIYGIDYLTHDIPVGLLAPSESEESFLKFFRLLKACKYPLRAVICDDRYPLGNAARYYYPKVKIQLCQNHYIENIRQALHTRIDPKHQRFFNYIYTYVFGQRQSTLQLYKYLHKLLTKQAKFDPLRQQIIMDIYKRKRELFQYRMIPDCPKDTNLIELYNSHLQARLKSIKGFKSFHAAERWLNAYLIRRRTKPLTDCSLKFKHLNGKSTFQRALKRGVDLPVINGVNWVKKD